MRTMKLLGPRTVDMQRTFTCINNRSQLSKVTLRKLSTAFDLLLSLARSWESLTRSICQVSHEGQGAAVGWSLPMSK